MQGQGEEISLTNSDASDLEKLINSKMEKDQIFKTAYEEDEKENERRLKVTDDFINFKPNLKSEILLNQNRSIPRQNPRPQSGRNIQQNSEINMGQHSFVGSPGFIALNNPQNQSQTPINPNHTQNMIKFNQPFANVPPPAFNIQAHKGWNSANKQMMENMRMAHHPYNNPKVVNNLSKPLNPSLSNKANIGKNFQKPQRELRKQNSDKHTESYATEDWFAKVDNQPSNKATEGTNDNQK